LVAEACSRNIDFKIGNNIFDKLLNINNIYPIVKFMPANEVDILPCDG